RRDRFRARRRVRGPRASRRRNGTRRALGPRGGARSVSRALATLGLVAFVGFGCQRSGDRATEQIVERVIAAHGRESKVAIDRDHGSISVTIGAVTKPPGWPSVVPIYPNASRAKIDEQRGDARRLSFVTEDAAQELDQFYRKRLASEGWQLDTTLDQSVR